jgi:hypothetical protein
MPDAHPNYGVPVSSGGTFTLTRFWVPWWMWRYWRKLGLA